MDSFQLFESEWKFKFDICCCIGIMCQFLMVVESITILRHTQRLMPFDTCLFPVFIPFKLCSGAYKKLHLHLFKFTHTEDKLTRHDLVTEGFSYLGNTKRYLHTPGFLYIKVVYKNSLCRFRTKVNRIGIIA